MRSNIVHVDGTCSGGGGVYDVEIEDVGLRERGRIIVGLSNDSGDDVCKDGVCGNDGNDVASVVGSGELKMQRERLLMVLVAMMLAVAEGIRAQEE